MAADETSNPAALHNFELVYPRPGARILTDVEPIGRSGHSMVCDDSNIYVLGGYNPLGRALNSQGRPTVLEEFWKFNLATKKWMKMETAGFPQTCASSCMLFRGNHVYIFGGTSYPFGQIVSNQIKMCNIANPQRGLSGAGCSGHVYKWDSLTEEPPSASASSTSIMIDEHKPPKGYGQSMVFHGDYVYTFGGAVGFYTEAINDLHRLNVNTLAWEHLEPQGEIPEGRYKQEIIVDNDR